MFRRNRSLAPSGEVQALSAERIDHVEPNIEKFLDDNADLIIDSAMIWHNIGEEMRWMGTDGRIVEAFQEGVADCFKTTEVPFNDTRVSIEAKRLLSTLGSYTQVVARSEASKGRGLMHKLQSIELLTKRLPGEGLPYIFTHGLFPYKEYGRRYAEMMSAMSKGDELSDEVLTNLCTNFAITPEHIGELKALYRDDAEESLPLLKELRALITADWYRLDPEKSILRQHCDRLVEDPSLHVVPFCEAVGRSEVAASVATMARYAIVSSDPSANVSGEAIAAQLHATRQRWHKVPDLQEEFNMYIESVSSSIADDFSSIAGPRSPSNARLQRSDSEVLELAGEMRVFATANAAAARQAKRQRSEGSRVYRKSRTKGGADLKLASTNEAIDQLTSQELLTPRSVAVASYVNGRGYEIREIDELNEEVLAPFHLEPDQKDLAKDMCRAIEYLRQPSRVIGVKRMQKVDPIRINGRQHRLWRLAPSHAPGLEINGNNRHYRIVYTISGSKVVVLDVLSHAEFDKKY